MQFPLPNTDLPSLALAVLSFKFLDVSLQFVEMMDAIVGDADGADEPGAFGFDQREPGAITGRGTSVGGMDQVSCDGISQRRDAETEDTGSDLTGQCNLIRFV